MTSMDSRSCTYAGRWLPSLGVLLVLALAPRANGAIPHIQADKQWSQPIASAVLRTVRVGLHPSAVAVDARTRRVFVLNRGPLHDNNVGTRTGFGSVSMLDAATGTVVRTVPVGQNPTSLGIDAPLNRVFVVNEGPLNHSGASLGAGSVSVLDAATGRLVQTIAAGHGPMKVAVDERNGHVFVSRQGRQDQFANPRGPGSVLMLDAATGAVLRTTALRQPSLTQALAIDQRAGRVLCAGGEVLDAQTGALLAAVVPRTPNGVAYDVLAVDSSISHAIAGALAGYMVADYTLAVLGTRTGHILHSAPVAGVLANGLIGIAIDESGHRAFVETGATLNVVDACTGRIMRQLPLGQVPFGGAVAYDAATRRLFVVVTAMGPAGSYARSSVFVIDSGRVTVLRRIPLGHGPAAIAVDDQLSRVYVANQGDNTVSVLDAR